MNHRDYYYKGYDVSNKNKMEKLMMEFNNPYGYNFNCNLRRNINLETKYTVVNEDFVKNKEFNNKKS